MLFVCRQRHETEFGIWDWLESTAIAKTQARIVPITNARYVVAYLAIQMTATGRCAKSPRNAHGPLPAIAEIESALEICRTIEFQTLTISPLKRGAIAA